MSIKKVKTVIFVTFARLLAKLPIFMLLKLGGFLGYLSWLIPNKRQKIAARNIALCFPELSATEQKNLLKLNLISTGMGFMEMLIAFWSPSKKLHKRVKFTGLQHVHNSLQKNKGCLLLSCHLHSLELCSRLINNTLNHTENTVGHLLARQHNNKVFEAYIDQARLQHCEKTIDKKDLKTVLKSLKRNHPVFYIPDQNFSYQCHYIDFFSQPAATVIAPVRIAQASQASVIPWFGLRKKDAEGKIYWLIEFLPPLDYFHQAEIETSLTRMNLLFETQIRKYPEQYLWVHRRFKNHPDGRNFVYRNL